MPFKPESKSKLYLIMRHSVSAGFPLSFICDDTGGSPIGSWGKIDFADIFNINPRPLLLDFLLDSAALTLAWLVLSGLRKGLAHAEIFRWAVLLCIGYMVAFLFAFLLFQSHTLNFEVPAPHHADAHPLHTHTVWDPAIP
jgi:hypothetical protein